MSCLTRFSQTETPARCLQKERPPATHWFRWAAVWPAVSEGPRQLCCVLSGFTHFGDVRQIACVRRAPTPGRERRDF
eukprot:CAMPEP_0204212984 /NCGR_PEP_ID=MMETSP0361-20130328/75657_1 /ASSEMBLY_ACC=CAM_ASM_000343 /TAXON_ID=268821 /ORGANISM="Scrippsiella Hangoei, Strain SHTV-5" /LENGTH=76 /DNA_ID=CAMNT_0051177391 /DNA_START=312 /DNA_END=542 /DNA_ORIENTATION=+